MDAIPCFANPSAKSLKGVNFIGVPKTIDNDVAHTDMTFGYNTAVSVATEALDRLHTTAASHHRVMILEVMGRYAGWIALESAIAGGADVALIPEIPYDINKIVEGFENLNNAGIKCVNFNLFSQILVKVIIFSIVALIF